MSIFRSLPVRTMFCCCIAGLFFVLADGVGCAWAVDAPSIAPYGQVARFGGLADGSGSKYEESSTPEVEEGKLVDPVGMVVDTNDPTAGSDGYAIYVLENVNPQAMNALNGEESHAGALVLEYRIQKFNDHGEVLASVRFSLPSSEAERGLQANAIAVASQAQGGRVYVLISDSTEGEPKASRIDAWTTELKPATMPHADADTGTGELVGPEATGSVDIGNINGVSLAVAGTSAGADLALGGTEYGSGEPVIDDIFTEAKSGHQPGELDGSAWHKASETEDTAAHAWQQSSQFLDWLSANPDGSLNAVLGPRQEGFLKADNEPNMAWVAANLAGSPRPVLPWADAAEGASAEAVNDGRAATVGFKSNQGEDTFKKVAETGATRKGGVLGPGVVGLSGSEPDFSSAVYAGVVAHEEGQGSEWLFDHAPASIAIRVFDEHEHSLATIGSLLPGPCNLAGGPAGENTASYLYGSFVALAAGRENTVFALVQSDLTSTENSRETNPAKAIGAGTGDEIVEFAPGAGQECPQPSLEAFAAVNKTNSAEQLPATGEVTVEKGTELEFDASSASLVGGVPWEYAWSFENEGAAPELRNTWSIEGHNWLLAPAQAVHKYEKTGSFEAKLELVNDFGTLAAQRIVHVAEAKPCHANFTLTGGALGQPVSLNAASSSCEGQGDGVKVYSWDFGDQKHQSTASPTLLHEYAEPGTYPIKLTVTDDFGHPFQSQSQSVTIAQEQQHEEEHPTTTPTQTTTTPQTTTLQPTTPSPTTPAPSPKPKQLVKPLTSAQKLTKALILCKKKPKRQRATCEKQAKKKYAAKPKSSSKAKSKHKK